MHRKFLESQLANAEERTGDSSKDSRMERRRKHEFSDLGGLNGQNVFWYSFAGCILVFISTCTSEVAQEGKCSLMQ